jgi:opacity protein-like surface antigen
MQSLSEMIMLKMRGAQTVAGCTFLLITFLTAPLFAQVDLLPGAPAAAATAPVFEAGAGYTYLNMDTPSRQRVGLSGVDANGFVDFNPRLGMVVDVSYARAGNVLGTPHNGNVVSCLTGPVFYPLAFGNTRIFVHTLVGVSLVNSAVPVVGTNYLGGTITRFSYALGGGVERTISGPFAIRLGGDYLRTTFANPNAAMAFQNNLRIVTGVVYRFGRH